MAAGGAATAEEQAKETGELEPPKVLFALEAEKPGGLAFDGKLLWVTDRVAGKLRGLDPVTGEQRSELSAPGPWPTGLAFDGTLLWVADKARHRLFGIDTRTRLVRREVDSPNTPLGLAFDGEHLWVADGRELHRVMREDGTTIVSFAAPTWSGSGRKGEQLGLAFHEGSLWVSDRLSDRLYRVDPADGEIVDILPAPGPFAAGLEVVDGRLLAVDVDRRRLVSVDLGALPRLERRDPRRQRVVLRREIVNRGPDTLAEVNVYVALPSNLPSQALNGEPVFSPEPQEIVEDQWGQRFARFVVKDLRPGKRLAVSMTVEATLFAVRHHLEPGRVGSLRSVPADIRKRYLADAAKFALEHPSIARHLKAALDGERRPWQMVRRISRYIGEHMEYELAGGWNIAPTVIDRGTGSCSEYTFVFIAMCRAAGIPARYAGAIVVRGDAASTDDVFHRWAEVWLPGYGWVPVDAQAADKPSPEQRAEAFGALDNRFLITTLGGGDSRIIGWDYNSTANWICRGRCDVEEVHLGDWYPVAPGP
jgi:transglutaminase-like putative cysteine protease